MAEVQKLKLEQRPVRIYKYKVGYHREVLFTNDLPPAGPGCLDILYADDITQIVTSLSKLKKYDES